MPMVSQPMHVGSWEGAEGTWP